MATSLPPEDWDKLFDAAHTKYVDDLGNLSDWAIERMYETMKVEGVTQYQAMVETAKEVTDAANQLSDRYYGTIRLLWEKERGKDLPPMPRRPHMTWQRVLWHMTGGTNDTGMPGYTFRQVSRGQAHGLVFDDLWQPITHPDDMEQFLGDWVQETARLSTMTSLETDTTHPRWARVPRGSKTCAWCLMLASRGYVYWSKETALGIRGQYHLHCDCQPVVSWDAKNITGYDPAAMRRQWDSAAAAADQQAGGKAGTTLRLRYLRAMYPGSLKDGSVFAIDRRILPGSDLEKKIGIYAARSMNKLLNTTPHADTARLWAKYANQYMIAGTNEKGTAHFTPGKGVYLDLKKAIAGDDSHVPYQILFHETGHNLDRILGGEKQYFSVEKEQFGFYTALQKDASELLKKTTDNLPDDKTVNRISNIRRKVINGDKLSYLDLHWLKTQIGGDAKSLRTMSSGTLLDRINQIEMEYDGRKQKRALEKIAQTLHDSHDEWEYGDVDDMLQAAFLTISEQKYPANVGHWSRGYWSRWQSHPVEAWAGMISSQITNKSSYGLMQQYFPRACKMFDQMVEEVSGDENT